MESGPPAASAHCGRSAAWTLRHPAVWTLRHPAPEWASATGTTILTGLALNRR